MIECIKEAEYKKSTILDIHQQPLNHVVVLKDMFDMFSTEIESKDINSGDPFSHKEYSIVPVNKHLKNINPLNYCVISENVFLKYPSLYIYYDTETKTSTEEERRGFILQYLYDIGFEPSEYNTDIAFNKFYSIDTGRLKIRIEMSKNAMITLYVYDRSSDSTHTYRSFFNQYYLKHNIEKYLKLDDFREIKLNKILDRKSVV